MPLLSLSTQTPPTPSLHNPTQKKTQHHRDLLRTCIRTRNLHLGRRLHLHLLQSNPLDPVLSNSLIALYSKCGRWDLARQLFDEMGHRRDIVSWTAMITAAARNGCSHQSLSLFLDMLRSGLAPNEFTLSSVVQACTLGENIEFSVMVLAFAIKMGFCGRGVPVACLLIDLFAKASDLVPARKGSDGMVERSVVVWTVMITRYMQNGLAKDAIYVFLEMRVEGFEPDQFTLSSVVSACIGLGSLR